MILSNFFIIDPELIDCRLRARLSLTEVFGIAFMTYMMAGFLWLYYNNAYNPYDFDIYLSTVMGNQQNYYYAAWALPFFHLLSWLPFPAAYVVWNLLNIFSVFFAARIFGGKPCLALLTYQMLYILYFGQITGIILGCLALFWWAAAHKRWDLAGLGLILATTKFQVGILIGGVLWLLAEISWRERFRLLVLPALIFLLSLWAYPGWIPLLAARIHASPPNDVASISLWRYLGPSALLFLAFPFLLPLNRKERMIGLISAGMLGLPYFQQADLISLFIFPTGWLPLVGNLGLLLPVFGYPALHSLAIIPLFVYILALLPGLARCFHKINPLKTIQ